ncbi:MAG: 2-oxo-4-hydroxy-4-carboxy-5-ureidoimidazoline decarboxylase [Deltaproteobacteria bacterium]|nr:2-oxo-4-hydroxy-4-carboxy-5-ureidoimidazoline decarboxylase [Nannocystaceae bacterium]
MSRGVSAWLDAQPHAVAREALRRCCGASRWLEDMLAARPFGSDARLFDEAARIWDHCGDDDVLEALTHHPEIGSDLAALRQRFADTASWASSEQSGVRKAGEATLVALRDGNLEYKRRFGHIFVVCAAGKSAAEMLALLQARLRNPPGAELAIAAAEQGKITRLRLEKLIP